MSESIALALIFPIIALVLFARIVLVALFR